MPKISLNVYVLKLNKFYNFVLKLRISYLKAKELLHILKLVYFKQYMYSPISKHN